MILLSDILRRGALKKVSVGWLAFIPAIAHVAMERGDTEAEAMRNLRDAMEANLPRVRAAWWTLVARPVADFCKGGTH